MSYKTLAPNYYSRLTRVVRNLGKGKICLNVGCSDGYYDAFILKKFERAVGIDVNMNDILVARSRNPDALYIVASATALPFKGNVFDEVICVDVLEHLKNDHKAVSEINKVLKTGKNAIITVPNKNYPFSYDPLNSILGLFSAKIPIGLWGFGHLRLYSEEDLKKIMEDSGFCVLKQERMLHFFCGIFENYYLVNLLQPLTKNDPKNLDKFSYGKGRKAKLIGKDPPKPLTKLRDFIMKADNMFFSRSRKSLGLLAVAKKVNQPASI